MPGKIEFIATIHESNGLSFYVPQSFVEWWDLKFHHWNNTITIAFKDQKKEPITINNVVFGEYRKGYRGSFAKWEFPKWKQGEKYLITVEHK